MGEWVAVVLDDLVKLLGETGGFFVCQVKVHDLQIRRLTNGGQSVLGNAGMWGGVSRGEKKSR
jgi:hypothetical protein